MDEEIIIVKNPQITKTAFEMWRELAPSNSTKKELIQKLLGVRLTYRPDHNDYIYDHEFIRYVFARHKKRQDGTWKSGGAGAYFLIAVRPTVRFK